MAPLAGEWAGLTAAHAAVTVEEIARRLIKATGGDPDAAKAAVSHAWHTRSGQPIASVEDASAPAADPLSVECSYCLAKPGKPCRFSRAGARMAGARKGDPCNPHITRVERARLTSHSAEADRG